jgi:hypothetical protein
VAGEVGVGGVGGAHAGGAPVAEAAIPSPPVVGVERYAFVARLGGLEVVDTGEAVSGEACAVGGAAEAVDRAALSDPPLPPAPATIGTPVPPVAALPALPPASDDESAGSVA